MILGPDGISGSLTPDAAEESGRRLLEASQKARVLSERPTLSGLPKPKP